MFYIPVAGTHGFSPHPAGTAWWQVGSPWHVFLRGQGFSPWKPGDPFVWSGALDGVTPGLDAGWYTAGQAFRWYCDDIPYEAMNLIVHSHALQVVLFAAARGVRIRRLISVCSPVRRDMAEYARQARPQIGSWLHVYSRGWSDWWQLLGGLFDGAVGVQRRHPQADRNDGVPAIGHAGVLRDSAHFHWWTDVGWLAFLAAPAATEAQGGAQP